MKGLIPRSELRSVCASLRAEGASLVFTNGCFDLLHPGHLRLLERAASFADRLLVAVNSDESVRRLKGDARPVYPALERAELLLSLRWVDFATIFEDDTPLETIEQVRPDVLVKGGEYLEKDIVGAKLVKSYGGKVERIPMKKGHSSRRIVNRIHGG